MFWVTRYPMISKTGSGRVGYRKKYRVAGRVRVPAGHWPYGKLPTKVLEKVGLNPGVGGFHNHNFFLKYSQDIIALEPSINVMKHTT